MLLGDADGKGCFESFPNYLYLPLGAGCQFRKLLFDRQQRMLKVVITVDLVVLLPNLEVRMQNTVLILCLHNTMSKKRVVESVESCPEASSYVLFVSVVTDQDTRRMIKLRAANEALFTGRRNAAKAAWK